MTTDSIVQPVNRTVSRRLDPRHPAPLSVDIQPLVDNLLDHRGTATVPLPGGALKGGNEMKKRNALVLTLIAAGFIVIATMAAMTTPAAAVDNPCDPTYNMLKACKANHGHFDTSCCCCVLH
jgi:hypothetical protein